MEKSADGQRSSRSEGSFRRHLSGPFETRPSREILRERYRFRLVVLLTLFSDYWAYDRWDPSAPMSCLGLEMLAGLAGFGLHHPSGATMQSEDLPDDHCACCAPLFAPPARGGANVSGYWAIAEHGAAAQSNM
jgi:hypothetical protein